MAYINGNDVLLHVGGGNDPKTCTVNINTKKAYIDYVAATTFQGGEMTAIVNRTPSGTTAATIENVVCGSMLYICTAATDISGALDVGKYNGGVFVQVPTQTGTVEIALRQ